MPHVVQTEALIAEGFLTKSQGAEIARRSRETMLALVVNVVLCGGIVAASLGFVFWIADAFGVALLGLAFLAAGIAVLARAGGLYRMLGHAATLIGGGMLIAGAGIEIAEKAHDIADWALLALGAVIAGAATFAFRKGPEALRFSVGALGLMGVAMHLAGLLLLVNAADSGLSGPVACLYATALIAAAGFFTNVRAVTALAIVPFAQALETGTTYWHAAYVFYSPESTLTILQMSLLIGACLWAIRTFPERIARHAGILSVMAAVVGSLAFLVGTLWGDHVGLSFFRDHAPRYADYEDFAAYQKARDLYENGFFHIGEHLYSVAFAIVLLTGAWFAAAANRRGLFNAAVTFLGIHAYTQMFETFSDEPMVFALGGLAAVPLAWGLWRLNTRMFGPDKATA